MDAIISYFDTLGLDFYSLLKTAGVLILGLLLLSVLGRFVFGKRSVLSSAISSAIGILFIFAVTVVLKSAGVQLGQLLAPLPYVSMSNDTLVLFTFEGADYTLICSQVLSMIILSFLVNLVDGWLPKGKNIISWLFFRCLTVVIALILHLVVTGLFTSLLPEGLVTYAPTVLLALLILMLLTGALKVLVGLVLTTVNPLIAALYTFFFANVVGKQITKAVLTTALLTGLVLLLQKLGIFAISIASAALIAYIPFVVLLVILWYVVRKVF